MKKKSEISIDTYIWGRNPVLEALAGDRKIDRILIAYNAHGPAINKIKKEASKKRVPVKIISTEKFSKLPLREKNHQGIAAVINGFDYTCKKYILEHPDFWNQRWVVLDGITDPHNLGAIIRTAEGAGFSGIIISEKNSAQVNDTVVKTSAGAVFHLPVIRVKSLITFLKEIRESGITLVGASADAKTSMYNYDFNLPFALIIGSEGKGISASVKKIIDKNIYIPLYGKISSLNASVSAAVLIYESIRRQNV